MDLEQRIKELERQLFLKKAYQSVNISFSKGNNIPKEVKDEVKDAIKIFCEHMATKLDQVEEEKPKATQIAKKANPRNKPTTLNEVIESAKNVQGEAPLRALLMTTDNLSKDQKQLVTSNSEVVVTGFSPEGDRVLINFESKEGIKRAAIPKEDIQLIEGE